MQCGHESDPVPCGLVQVGTAREQTIFHGYKSMSSPESPSSKAKVGTLRCLVQHVVVGLAFCS